MSEPVFPVLRRHSDQHRYASVPWTLVAPHERQAWHNHGQTLRRLAERGGLSLSELVAVIENRKYSPISDADAVAILDARLVVNHPFEQGYDPETGKPEDVCGRREGRGLQCGRPRKDHGTTPADDRAYELAWALHEQRLARKPIIGCGWKFGSIVNGEPMCPCPADAADLLARLERGRS